MGFTRRCSSNRSVGLRALRTTALDGDACGCAAVEIFVGHGCNSPLIPRSVLLRTQPTVPAS